MDARAMDNLSALTTLDESSLLEAIRQRYDRDIIYTYLGDILVAMNPYKHMPFYSNEVKNQYKDLKIRSQMPPHLYAISDFAYQNMRRTGHNQCAVVSGESGAGKTETTKLMVEHVAHLCNQAEAGLHERIIQVNPLLEAFGNAQTVMNTNSSRFGKYIELCFDHQGAITGARIAEYLLEKSRVVSQGHGERNFHIFYYMFAGIHPDQLKVNLLDRPEQHRILQPANGSQIYQDEVEFRYHQDMWKHLRDIMDVVGFHAEEVNMILALLAAVLHITDIVFDNDFDTDGVYITQEDRLELAAELLAVPPEELAAAFISNVTYFRSERIVTLKTIEQANDGRDAIAKALYARLFGWIVRQINQMLQPDRRYHHGGPTIGILDIAGFENFETNSFEQLCINAANEQLQFYFNQHIFQWELDEYKKEGVKGKDIKFIDNRPNIDLLLEAPLGIFSLIDEESRFPQATDGSLVDKLVKNCQKKSLFTRPKGSQLTFVINHYAGPVTYTATNFLEKNRDTLNMNLLEVMMNSESQIIVDLFTSTFSDTGHLQFNPNTPKRSRKSLLLCKAKDFSYTKTRSLSKRAGKRLKEKAQEMPGHAIYENTVSKSMSSGFKNSLTDLMAKLLAAQPQFIRCIKPNGEKKPNFIHPAVVTQQLKYTGVLETVRIRRLGYSTRIPHPLFIDRFRMLLFPFTARVDPTAANCSKILKKCGLKEWEMGKTKVFLKYWHVEQLNILLDKFGWRIVHCQRFVRGFIARCRFRGMRELSRQDAAAVRGFCIYVTKESDDRYGALLRQQTSDEERWQDRQKEMREKAMTKSRPQQFVVPSTTNLRARSPSPVTRLSTGTLVPGSPLSATSPTRGRFIASPPSSPLYATSAEANAKVAEVQPMYYRRQPSREDTIDNPKDYEYPTLGSVQTPTKQQASDYNDQSHLRRANIGPKVMIPVPAGNDSSKDFYTSILMESVQKLPSLDPSVWCKIYYIEKGVTLAKVYVKEAEIIIDGSKQDYDGFVIGLGAFENPERDSKTEKIHKQIGKGVKIRRDEAGNIFASKLTKADVIVKGYKDRDVNCVSDQVVESLGRLRSQPLKMFDIQEYKKRIGKQIRESSMDQTKLQRLSIVSFAFVRNTFEDMETPCWICIVNFSALNLLGQDSVLREVQNIADMRLSDVEEVQLKRSWNQMNIRANMEDPYSIYGNPSHERQSRKDALENNSNPGQSQGRSGSPGYADSITPDSESPYSNNLNSSQSTTSSNASTGTYQSQKSIEEARGRRNWAKFGGPRSSTTGFDQ